jgi:hypothetical protein
MAHDHPDCRYCSETMTFARVAAAVRARREQSVFLCVRCGHVETRARPKAEAHADSLLMVIAGREPS